MPLVRNSVFGLSVNITEDIHGNPLWKGAAWPATVSNVEWVNVLNKPTSFTPSIHTHTWSDITNSTVPEALRKITQDGSGNPLWNGSAWPGGSGSTVDWADLDSHLPLALTQISIDGDGNPTWDNQPWPGTIDWADLDSHLPNAVKQVGMDVNGKPTWSGQPWPETPIPNLTTLTTNPDPADGKNGDTVINLSTWTVFVKESGVWVNKGVIKGTDGVDGEDGTGINVKGSLSNSSELALIVNPAEGDGYLITGHLWIWDGSTWVDAGNIQGPQGENGNTILTDTFDPTTEGKNGDYFVNQDTWHIWYKTGGTWVDRGSIKGNTNTILTNTVNPNLAEGKDGDYFINQTTWHIWFKSSGVWDDKGSIIGGDVTVLNKISEDVEGNPTWDGAAWPGGSGGVSSWNDLTDKPEALGKVGQDGTGQPTWDGAAWPGGTGGSGGEPVAAFPHYTFPKFYTIRVIRNSGTDRLEMAHSLPAGWTFETGANRYGFTIRHNENKLVAFMSYNSLDIPIPAPDNEIGMGYMTLYNAVGGQPAVQMKPDGSGTMVEDTFYNTFYVSGLSENHYIISFILIDKLQNPSL